MPPTVSINLCCYNSEKFLEETLQSIFTQKYRDWELVIIDDGSTDSTGQIIKKYISEGWPIVYHYQRNSGLGAARNKAISLSRGKFIALIDHDDLWNPEKLEKQMVLFEGRPQVGVVYTAYAVINSSGEILDVANCNYYRGQVLIPLILDNVITCSAIVIRRSLLNEIGLFNQNFVQVEEFDLLIRAAEKYNFDYLDEPLTLYRVHSLNASRDFMKVQAEFIGLMQQVLTRSPWLVDEIGKHVLRIRLKGFGCSLGEYYLLRGDLKTALKYYGNLIGISGAIPRVFGIYILSFFAPQQVNIILNFRRNIIEKFHAKNIAMNMLILILSNVLNTN